jgi:hypothetical protein
VQEKSEPSRGERRLIAVLTTTPEVLAMPKLPGKAARMEIEFTD